jgi:hypothetical protein
VQPSGVVDPNLKVLGGPAGTGGGDSEPWISRSIGCSVAVVPLIEL